ncbi:MAG: preprotein translocase subunit SecE [Thermacetogeniaceae bacterium]
MSKKAGAAKEKKSEKIRLDAAASQSTAEEPVSKRQGKISLLFRKKEDAQNKPKAVEVTPSKSRDEKKAQAKGKEIKKEAGKQKRSFFKESARFFQSTWAELKRVHWPSRQEIVVYTAVVIGSVVALALIIWLVDSALSWLLELII